MIERPILFSAPMVLALLAGTKTQTRRIVKFVGIEGSGFNPEFSGYDAGHYFTGDPTSGWVLRSRGSFGCWNDRTKPLHCPQGQPGDRLWVRETFSPDHRNVYPCPDFVYRADRHAPTKHDIEECCCRAETKARRSVDADCLACAGFKWRPSIFMPRRASRITLEVTGVRVERLQSISDADAIAEGIEVVTGDYAFRNYWGGDPLVDPVTSYRSLWDTINGVNAWEANPWVWAIEFRRLP